MLRFATHAAQCLVGQVESEAKWPECEQYFLSGLGGLQAPVFRNWKREKWQLRHEGHLQNYRGETLRLAQYFAEVSLHSYAWTWIRQMSGVAPLASLEELSFLHACAGRYLRHLIAHLIAQNWARKSEKYLEAGIFGNPIFNKERISQQGHIAMVASVGRPSYAAKAMAGIRSALFSAGELPIHAHLFVDREGAQDLDLERHRFL